jgi:hypothetical protein
MTRLSWFTLAFGLLVLPLASCSSSPSPTKAPPSGSQQQGGAASPKELLLGKWQRTDAGKESTLEFMQGGKMKLDGTEGTFKFLDDGTIEYEYSPAFEVFLSKCKFKVTPAALVLEVVEAKSKPGANEAWTVTAADNQRKGTEKYKKAQ